MVSYNRLLKSIQAFERLFVNMDKLVRSSPLPELAMEVDPIIVPNVLIIDLRFWSSYIIFWKSSVDEIPSMSRLDAPPCCERAR